MSTYVRTNELWLLCCACVVVLKAKRFWLVLYVAETTFNITLRKVQHGRIQLILQVLERTNNLPMREIKEGFHSSWPIPDDRRRLVQHFRGDV